MKHLVVTLIILASAASVARASCGSGGGTRTLFQSVTDATNSATAVFRGKVVGWEWRKGDLINRNSELSRQGRSLVVETKVTKFKVDRWWKMAVGPEVFVLTQETRDKEGVTTNSSDYNFKEGESYLVFPIGTENLLRIGCSMVLPLKLQGIEAVFEILGEGMPPRPLTLK